MSSLYPYDNQMLPHPPPPVQPRSRALGVLTSFILPGLGSVINGSLGMGTIIILTFALGIVTLVVGIGVFIMAGAWIWGMIDGALAADRWNRKHGIIS